MDGGGGEGGGGRHRVDLQRSAKVRTDGASTPPCTLPPFIAFAASISRRVEPEPGGGSAERLVVGILCDDDTTGFEVRRRFDVAGAR